MDQNNMSQKKQKREKLRRLGMVLCIFLGLGVIGNVVQYLAGMGSQEPAATEAVTEAPTEPRAMGEVLEIPAEDLRDLKIDWVTGTVTVTSADVENICIQETEAKKKLNYTVRDGELLIQYSKDSMQSLLGIHSKNGKDLIVQVPRTWKLENLWMQSAGANIVLKDLQLRDLEYDGVSGLLTVENCSMEDLDLRTVSGDVKISGSLRSLECQGVSANCGLTLSNVPEQLTLKGASGGLDLVLPQEAGFTLELEGVASELDTDFQVTEQEQGILAGDGSCRISVEGISGGLHIHKAS